MTRLSSLARTIRNAGGTVVMRRVDGHESPWAYLAGSEPVAEADVRSLEDAGVLTRIEPGIAGCERCRYVLVRGAA